MMATGAGGPSNDGMIEITTPISTGVDGADGSAPPVLEISVGCF